MGKDQMERNQMKRNQMKRIISAALTLFMLPSLLFPVSVSADQAHTAAVYELYSVDGFYEDSVGNAAEYSYHVPQFYASSPAADEINAEIAERFGGRVEAQFESMEGGYSLWSWHTEWQAFWNGSQLFLLVTADENGGFHDYAAYGYDFDSGSMVTNEMILEQKGIREEVYQENLREAVQLKFEDMYGNLLTDMQKKDLYDEMLDQTLVWLDSDPPMFIDQFGEIETIVKIVSVAGAGWYYHLVSPFGK